MPSFIKMFSRHPDSSITMSSSCATASQRRHTQVFMEFNQEMFKRNVLTDVECVVEGQVFQAHRALLACFSSYLKKKLVNEDGKPLEKKVYIPKIGSSEFEILLRYMYSGILEVDCSNCFEVWSAASFLEMQKAQEEWLKLIDGTDEIRTYFYTYILSKKLGFEPNRQQKALKLITHRFEETVFTKEFMQLDLQYVLEILSAQSIGARSETVVFLAALNWLDQDYGSRHIHAVPVMECVRFSCMSMEEIVACFHPPLLYHVVQIPEVLSMLFKGTCYVAAKSKGEERWFKQYANIKRDLTQEKLPMKLWHKETSRSEDPQMDSQRADSSTTPKYTESGLPESLKGHIQTMLDSEDSEKKQLAQFLDAKFKTSYPRYPGKEDSNNSVQPQDLLFRDRTDNFKDDELDNESISFDRADYTQEKREDSIRSLSRTNQENRSPFLSRKRNSDILRISPIKPESTASGHQEIRCIEPEDAKIIHLVKKPLKYKEEKTESLDILKKSPEKPVVVLEDEDFEKKEGNKKEPKVSQSIIFSDRSIKESGCILVIGGMDPNDFRKDSGGNVLIFNVKLNKWLPYTDLPEPRHNHSSACIGNTLYVIGGCNSKETIEQNRHVPKSSCYKLNLEKTKWSMMSNMTCARFDHAMIVYKGSLIVIGGQDEKGRLLKSVEMYDPKEKRWKLLSNMCCGRKAMGAAVFADRIWIAGGVIPSSGSLVEVVTHVDLYHPDEKKWHFNSYSLPSARSHCCLIEWDGKLYCIGGMVQIDKGKQCATDEVWFVDSENQLWKLGPKLPEPRMGGTAVIYGNNLYYVGGYDPGNRSNIQNVIYLTPGAASWNIGPPMIYGMFGLSAVSFRIIEDK